MTHSSPWEIAWLIIAAFGLSLGWLAKLNARDDRIRTETSPYEMQRYMMRAIHISARYMLAVHALIFLAALWANFNPPPPPPIYELQSFENILAWMAVSILLTTQGFMARRWRARISKGFDTGTGDNGDRRKHS